MLEMAFVRVLEKNGAEKIPTSRRRGENTIKGSTDSNFGGFEED